MPALPHEKIMRRGERLQTGAELREKSLDGAGMARRLPRHGLDDRQ